MNETLTDPLTGYGAVALGLTFAGSLAGLVRAYIAHRTRLQVEREASARTATRMAGLIGLSGTHHVSVRFAEKDRDGHRVVALGGCDMAIGDVQVGKEREAAG